MNQEYALLSSVQRFGTIRGKKAWHKILYFENLIANDFIFRWNSYGPYSDDVQQFFDDAYMDEIIDVQKEQVGYGGIQYNISLNQKGNQVLQSLENDNSIDHERINQALEFSHKILNDKTPREMELLTSVHYIISDNEELDSEEIFEIIANSKPDSNFTLDEVEWALEVLHEFNLA